MREVAASPGRVRVRMREVAVCHGCIRRGMIEPRSSPRSTHVLALGVAPQSVGVVLTRCLGGVGVRLAPRRVRVVAPRSVGVILTRCLGDVGVRLLIALDVARHAVPVLYLQLREERGQLTSQLLSSSLLLSSLELSDTTIYEP